MVPNRRPPSPHSCSMVRSPLRQCAAKKPMQVTKPNRAIKTIRAVMFIVRSPGSMFEPVHDADDHRAQDDPGELIPVEEWYAVHAGFHAVVEWHPQHCDERYQQQQACPRHWVRWHMLVWSQGHRFPRFA